jgi:hypothetical protein
MFALYCTFTCSLYYVYIIETFSGAIFLILFIHFREHRKKENISWNNDLGTITYREIRSFTFDRDKSAGPQSDTFTTVNLPMIVST